MAKDIVFQNVLKSLDQEDKTWGKDNQPRSPKVVRALLKIQSDMIRKNIKDIKANINRALVFVVRAEQKQLQGDRHKRLLSKAREAEHHSCVEKWEGKLKGKYTFLEEKYGKIGNNKDDDLLSRSSGGTRT